MFRVKKMPSSGRGALVAAGTVLLLTAVYLLAVTTSIDVSLGLLSEPTIPGAGHKYGASCQNCLDTRCTKPWNGCDKHMGYEDASGEQHHACMCGCCALQCNLYRGCEASPTAYSSAAHFNKQLLFTSSANTVWETVKENGRWMIRKDGQPFTIKGACYSPTEIAGDINFVDVASGTTTWGDYFCTCLLQAADASSPSVRPEALRPMLHHVTDDPTCAHKPYHDDEVTRRFLAALVVAGRRGLAASAQHAVELVCALGYRRAESAPLRAR